MDVSTVCAGSISEFLNGPYVLKQSYANHKQCFISMNDITEDSVMEKLGDALSGILCVQDEDKICYPERNVLSEEFNEDQSKPLNAAVSCSERTPCLVYDAERDDIPDTPLHQQSSMKSENLVCNHQITLSTPTKRISAMKGSREKQGILVKKLSVTWAPDVYDPPSTSLSHTVKNHQQRSRNKKNSKQKQKHKGKSSQGNSKSKQYRKHNGKTDIRSKSPSRSLFGGYHQSTVELMDFSVIGHDSRCGSSFLRTSLAEMHIPVTEAT